MIKKKTILFFTIEVGLAHVTRSLAIAERLQKKGYHVLFALPKRKASLAKGRNIEIVDIRGYTDSDSIEFVRKMKDKSFLRSFIEEELDLIKKYKPNAVVNDFRVSTLASTYISDVPCFFVTGGGGLPYGIYIPNPGLPKIVHTCITPMFRAAIERVKSIYIDNIVQIIGEYNKKISKEEIFRKLLYIVPEAPGYLPNTSRDLTIHYTGPIFWNGFSIDPPAWISKLHKNKKTVYLTFGGTGFDSLKMRDISKALLDRGYTVIVSASTIASPDIFPVHPRLKVEKYLPGREISKRVDVVVCHGGYGTMMEAVLAGTPVVAIPFNPDQVLHSLRFQELGLGKSLASMNTILGKGLLSGNWQMFEEIGKHVQVNQVVAAVTEVVKEGEMYQRSIRQFQDTIPKEDGAMSAAEFIGNNL